ncbi:amidohydrolase family protein [Arthrobacter pigmenti]
MRQHAHRADDIATALRIAAEFGYDLVLDHGTEAHLLADVIAEKGIPVLIGPLFTARSKVELRQRSLPIRANWPPPASKFPSSPTTRSVPIHFLVHQTTLTVKEGLDRQKALEAITINPKVMGVADRVGSLKVARMPTWCCGAAIRSNNAPGAAGLHRWQAGVRLRRRQARRSRRAPGTKPGHVAGLGVHPPDW